MEKVVFWISFSWIGVSAWLLFYVVIDRFFLRKYRIRRRISQLTGKTAAPNVLAKALPQKQKNSQQLEEMLQAAGISLSKQQALQLAGAILGIPFLFGLVGGALVQGLLIGVTLLLASLIWLRIRSQKRKQGFNRQLFDILMMMSNSLRSGYSFLQTIQSLAQDIPEPAAGEFSKMLRELQLGIATEEALHNMNARLQSDDFDMVITAILIQRQIGGNLAEILDNIAETIRERVRIQGEIRALTAQGRLSAWIFMIMPVGIAFMLFLINPAYLGLLFTTSIGLVMLTMAVLGQIVGAYFIRKIVSIEI